MIVFLVAMLVLQDPPPQKLKFTVEHLNLDTKKTAPLKSDEAKAFEKELKELPAVADATCTETTATITLKPDGTLKLSELRGTGKKTLTYDGGKPVIVFNTIKLEGKVTLTLKVDKNKEKVKDALKDLGFKDISENGDDYDATIKSPVDLVTVVKKVCAKTGADYKIFEILKEIVWRPAK